MRHPALLISLAIALVLPAAALAQEGAAAGETHILIVGVNEYRDPKIPALRFAEPDARAVFAFFATERRSPTVRDRVSLVAGKDATRSAILQAIREKLQQRAVRPEDTAILYFAGHGFADAQTTYLAPADAALGSLPETAISSETLAEYWGRVRAGRKLMILDACHAGAIEGVRGIGGVAQAPVISAGVSGAAAAAGAGPLSLLIAATGPSELSTEDKDLGQGVFTLALLKGLRGEADLDADGWVTDGEVGRFLGEEVPALAARAGGKQSPTITRVGPEGALAVLARAPDARGPAPQGALGALGSGTGATGTGGAALGAPSSGAAGRATPPSSGAGATGRASSGGTAGSSSGAPAAGDAGMPPFASSEPPPPATVSLQALIDASRDGGTVRVPRARYVVRQPIKILQRSFLTIACEPGAEVLCALDDAVIEIEDSVAIRIENLKAGHVPQGGGCGTPVVSIRSAKEIALVGCELYGCGVIGVDASGVRGLHVTRCYVHHSSWCAFSIDECEAVTIARCRIEDNRSLFAAGTAEPEGVELADCKLARNGEEQGDGGESEGKSKKR